MTHLTETVHDGFDRLARTPARELERLLQAAPVPPLASLVGSEWRGLNLGRVPQLLGIRKFIKGFVQEGEGAGGYNVRVGQGAHEGWRPLPSAAAPRRYAYFAVYPVRPGSRDRLYLHALLLDYASGYRSGDPPLAQRIRDYLVQPDPTDPDLLLGKAYLALGPWRLPANFFVLQRL